MKILFSLLFALPLVFWASDSNAGKSFYKKPAFFKNSREMHQILQSALNQVLPGGKLERIEHISYIGYQEKSYAFVYYRSNKGNGKLVIQKTYLAGNKISFSSVYCEGSGCNCQVTTVIGNDGGVKVGCSCSSCTMLVNTITTTPY